MTHGEDDGTVHAAKLEERNGSLFTHCVSKLKSQVGADVSGESVRLFWSGRHRVFKCLEVGLVRLVKVGVHWKPLSILEGTKL